MFTVEEIFVRPDYGIGRDRSGMRRVEFGRVISRRCIIISGNGDSIERPLAADTDVDASLHASTEARRLDLID